MNILLLIVSIILSLLSCGILRNEFCKKELAGNSDLYLFNTVNSVLSAITLAIVAAVSGSLCVPSLYTLLMGTIFGMATGLCAILCMIALEKGPLSYTNVIVSCAMVIPALSGLVLYGEPVSAWQYVGIALMIVSFICAVDGDNGASGASLKWLLLCIGAFICSGSVGVMQKLHQNSVYKEELGVFLVTAFVVSALFSLGMTLFFIRKPGERITVLSGKKFRKFAIISFISGVGFALVNQINMYLAGVIDAIIFYPVVNGASMILTTAAGIILWKEKLSKRQWFGLVMGGLAILLLCNIL